MDIQRFFKRVSEEQERDKGADAEEVSIEVSKGPQRNDVFGHNIVQRFPPVKNVANVAYRRKSFKTLWPPNLCFPTGI